MKFVPVLGLIAMTLSSVSAFASDGHGDSKKKTLKFDVFCKFSDNKHDLLGDKDPGQDDKEKDKDRCFAAASFVKKISHKDDGKDGDDDHGRLLQSFHNDDDMDGDKDGDGKKKNRNKFAVVCNKSLIYADGAEISKNKHGDKLRIEGLPKGIPAVTIDLDDKHGVSTMDGSKKLFDAKLELKKDEFWGSCKIRVKKVDRDGKDGHDDHGDWNDYSLN